MSFSSKREFAFAIPTGTRYEYPFQRAVCTGNISSKTKHEQGSQIQADGDKDCLTPLSVAYMSAIYFCFVELEQSGHCSFLKPKRER